jgi:hypothetical protein
MGGNISLTEKEESAYKSALNGYTEQLLTIVERKGLYDIILPKIMYNLSVDKFKSGERTIKIREMQNEDEDYFEHLKKEMNTLKFNKEREANVIISILEGLLRNIIDEKVKMDLEKDTDRFSQNRNVKKIRENNEKIKRMDNVIINLKGNMVDWFNYMDPSSSGSRITGMVGDPSKKKFKPIRTSMTDSKKQRPKLNAGRKSRNKRNKVKNKRKTKSRMKK